MRERDRLRENHCAMHLKIHLCLCKSIHATKYILMLLQKSEGFSGITKIKALCSVQPRIFKTLKNCYIFLLF